MKVVGITVLLAGIFFTVFVLFLEPLTPISTHTSGWAPWIGLLIIATGSFTIFKTRK
jgi:hypothetical protein